VIAEPHFSAGSRTPSTARLQPFRRRLYDPRTSISATVTQKVRAAASARRIFYVEYDISGARDATWRRRPAGFASVLRDQLDVFSSPQYAPGRKPVVVVWGFGFGIAPATALARSADPVAAAAGVYVSPRGCRYRLRTGGGTRRFRPAFAALDLIPRGVGTVASAPTRSHFQNIVAADQALAHSPARRTSADLPGLSRGRTGTAARAT